MKLPIKDYFVLSKKERNAAFVLIVFLIALIVLPLCYTPPNVTPTPDPHFEKMVVQLMDQSAEANHNTPSEWQEFANPNNEQYSLFTFNPNTLNAEGWRKLGVKDKTIRTIFNYLGKGGHFYKPEDIKKIWGLSPEIANRIIPYAQIENTANTEKPSYASAWNKTAGKAAPIPEFDINTATIEQLRGIKQLDIGLAYRILKFRDKLGGFISLEQIKETHGMTDTSFMTIEPYLKKQPSVVFKININTASEDDLGNHPYINKPLAKAIVFYRNKNGLYQTVADLKRIVFLKDDLLQKIAPYLSVQ